MMNKYFLENLPASPGVYKMLDDEKNILYVGKAGNLKKRVSSYFTRSNHSVKTQRLVAKIRDIDYQITSNEQDALLLENNLIKEFKPKYNILLRDDKSYPYIFMNKNHDFPGFKFFRGKPSKNGYHFGPYTHVVNVRKILTIIQKTFQIRLCEDSYYKARTKPCMQYQIKRCSGPCVGLINKEEYNKTIESAQMFLKGETKPLFNKLEKEMMLASNNKNFEVAAKYRDNIKLIRDITSHYSIFPEDKSIDFVLCIKTESKILVDINIIRNGVNMGCKNFTFPKRDHINIDETLASFFKQYYLTHIPPNIIISKDKILDKNNIETVINKKFRQNCKILSRIDKKYSEFMNICLMNLHNRSLKSIKQEANSLDNINTQLKITSEFILCFDVSHISGSSTVGSAVYFNSEGFIKSNYRRYNIKNIKKSDDYAALKAMIKRRLLKINNYITKNILIIVDGGKGQITQARKVVNELDARNITIIGIHKGLNRLTKNDRILDSSNKDISNIINKDAMTLIQQVRDEAHRFAILNQRKRHNKLMFNSKLDGIPGVGNTRKKLIINHFGGIQGVLKASIRELKSIDGINEKLANVIYTHIHK
jgi:excinuclease ABC subunit C